jgi:lipoprotein-releasing system permease protein
MFKPFYAFVGYRYIRAKRKNHFISFISLTSVVGVALGVSVLITVLSVMNGFNHEIRAQMLLGTPHVTVGRIGGPLTEWQGLMKTLTADSRVIGAAPYILGQGMLSNAGSGKVQGVLIKGLDPNQINEVYPLATKMKEGSLAALQAGQYNMVMGQTLALNLGVELGDKLSLIVPEASVTPAGIMPRIKRFTVVGIFEIGDLYDGSQAFIHLRDADKLFRINGGITGVQLKLKDELEAPAVARAFYDNLQEGYWITDWTQDFGSFFKALQIQKTVMMFILLLIITVAAFNLVSSLVMMVTDKRSDIAILRALGASRRTIMGIFVAQGSFVGLLGTVSGVLLGLYMAYHVTGWTAFLQKTFNIELVSRDVYLVNFLPSEVHSTDVFGVVVVTLLMCFIATLYPAWRAASIEPAEALRYE